MKVVIAMDESSNADMAFEWYFANVHKEGNEVILYSYAEMPRIPKHFLGGMPMVSRQEIDNMQSKFQEKCIKLKGELGAKSKKFGANAQVIVDSHDGGPGRNIIRVAEEEEANAIVTGSRGQGKISRTIFGSVSTYVLHHAKIPVFIFRES